MADERLYVVTYDISDPKRWRKVFRTMEGYGRWLQLSVFQCRLTPRRRAALAMRLDRLIKTGEDRVLILDLGRPRRCICASKAWAPSMKLRNAKRS